MIRGEVIGLRPLQTEDVWLLFKWFNDQRVVGDLGCRHALFCVSIEEERRIVERKLASPDNRDFVIVDLAADRAIGWTGLSHIDQRNASAELDLIIGEVAERGKGREVAAARMMVEHAFDGLNLHRLYARVPGYNAAAIAVLAAAGFEEEGVLRDDHYHHGRFASSVMMSALRDEARSGR